MGAANGRGGARFPSIPDRYQGPKHFPNLWELRPKNCRAAVPEPQPAGLEVKGSYAAVDLGSP
jgi:hypothetical protein